MNVAQVESQWTERSFCHIPCKVKDPGAQEHPDWYTTGRDSVHVAAEREASCCRRA